MGNFTPRLCRLIRHLHALGPRATGEFVAEIASEYDIPDSEIADRLERYGRLDPAVLRELGGDDFPALPLALVETK